MRRLWLVVPLLLTVAGAAWGDAEGDLLDFDTVGWILRSIPINYSVHLLFLFIGLLVTRQLPPNAWKTLPAFAVLASAGGYCANLMASPYGPPWQAGSFLLVDTSGVSFEIREMLVYVATASSLVFLINLGLVALILRVWEAESYARVPVAAGAMAVGTVPYVGLPFGASLLALLMASVIAVTAIGVCYLPRRIMRRYGWETALVRTPESRVVRTEAAITKAKLSRPPWIRLIFRGSHRPR